MASSERLIFANHLRGIAALLVVASHLIGVYWAEPQVVSEAFAVPPVVGTPPPLFSLVSQPWFSPGQFGVALFFLISGLVIPISLSGHTRGTFLLARAARIYPVAICALAIDIVIIRLNAANWKMTVPFGSVTMLTNFLLINDVTGQRSIDLVNWTLCIELKFYVAMAIFAPAIRCGRLWPLFVISILPIAAGLAFSAGYFPEMILSPVYILARESKYLCYMAIGVLFNYHLRGFLSEIRTALCGAALLACFFAGGLLGPTSAVFMVVASQYACALVLFGLAYTWRRHAIPIATLDASAAISYPLYLIHPVLGISTMRWLALDFGFGYLHCLALGFAVAVGVATLLHFLIERRSTEWGRRLSRGAGWALSSR